MAEAVGEVEVEGGVLVVKRIHINYRLKLDPALKEAALRAHSFHADRCPMARTIGGSVKITTSLDMEFLDGEELPPSP